MKISVVNMTHHEKEERSLPYATIINNCNVAWGSFYLELLFFEYANNEVGR